MGVHGQPPIRFGVFELHIRSGELLRKGSKVNLQDQPFQALVLLLEHPGELVTREELRKNLWPQNTFVDFERGLNKAINKLRAALRDNPDKPQYIETLPQRGYRFIAPIENAAPAPDPLRTPSAPRIDSIAVLPLENLSDDPAEEYFSDGMTEELICAIARIDSLRVISRTSAMLYKGSRKSLPEIAKELGVDAILEGTVARSGERVRITAQLIYAPEEKQLWAGRYARDLREILQLQAEIAQNIAVQIHKLVDPKRVFSQPARQVHPQAYEACLKGNFFRDKMTPEDLEKSLKFYTQAISLDPAYAQAYGELSQTYFYCGVFGMGHPGELFPRARVNAVKALELDETVPSAHNALAAIHIFYDWDWNAAEAESRRAVELSPGVSVTRSHLADYMSLQGRHGEAISEIRQVLNLDPVSVEYNRFCALILYRARRCDESIAQCKVAQEFDPNDANTLWFFALALEEKGELHEAIAKLKHAVSLSPAPHYKALLGRACALAGERAKAIEILDELKAMSQRRYISPFDLAVVSVGLGDLDAAFQWFEEAYRQRVFRLVELTMPMFDSLRPDPRWQDLVLRIGLPTSLPARAHLPTA
jgi:TolB-like protein/Flp pilus assembly protein TadD